VLRPRTDEYEVEVLKAPMTVEDMQTHLDRMSLLQEALREMWDTRIPGRGPH
jgi:hypothetical protein